MKWFKFALLFSTFAITTNTYAEELPIPKNMIYLYGEQYGVPEILDKELEEWGEYYELGVRHMFLEMPYYVAEFLNEYMQAEDGVILDELYNDIRRQIPDYKIENKEFFRAIKAFYPATVFHGTDVGHMYDTIGVKYMDYLQDHNFTNTQKYTHVLENIIQGMEYYRNKDMNYREEKLVENFVREKDQLQDGESLMGIYGLYNTNPLNKDSMASDLIDIYGNHIFITDLTRAVRANVIVLEDNNNDIITLNNKQYKTSYYGAEDLSDIFPQYASRRFWRIEDAYKDFMNAKPTGDFLPYYNYPMDIDTQEVFMVEYLLKDGTTQTVFYRSDGLANNLRQLTTTGFLLQ